MKTGNGRLTSIVSSFALLLYLAFLPGLWFHTSSHPVVFGKYGVAYFAALSLLVLLSPYVFMAARFILTTHRLRLPSGRHIVLRPAGSVTAVGLAVLLPLLSIEAIQATKRPDPTTQLKEFHPYLQTRPVAGDAERRINRWGFRGEEIEFRKPPGTYRIFVLGGSTVYCGNVDFEESHPRILELALRRRYPDHAIEVQNAGMEWYTSEHSLIQFLTRIQDFSPDAVIIYHGINDLYRSFSPKALAFGPYQDDYSHYYGPLRGMIRSYAIRWPPLRLLFPYTAYTLSGYWFSDLSGEGRVVSVPIDHWKSLHAFERNMRDFAEVVRAKRITLVMASEPSLYRNDLTERERAKLYLDKRFMVEDGKKPDLPSLVKGMEAFNQASRAIAWEAEVPFFDLDRLVPKTLEYFVDDVHYTVPGNRLIGEAFAQRVIELRLIERQVSQRKASPADGTGRDG